jgi:hypothetical protein
VLYDVRARVGHTIFLGARREVGRCRSHHHASSLVGDGDEEVMDLLQVEFGHVVRIELLRREVGERRERGEKIHGMVG